MAALTPKPKPGGGGARRAALRPPPCCKKQKGKKIFSSRELLSVECRKDPEGLFCFFGLQLSERLEAPFVNNPQVGAGVAGVEAFLFYSFMDTYGPYGA